MAGNRDLSETVTNDSSWLGRVSHTPVNVHIHDVVCVGFGSNAIALAIALKESSTKVDVMFLERQQRADYAPLPRLPGSFMQLSFLNDLVTFENPRSKFTYLKYLQTTDQLIQFTNLSSMQPLREQFTNYLRWCADKFEDSVRYGSEVRTVRPVRTHGSVTDAWSVEYHDIKSGKSKIILAKQVVCAGEPQPNIPAPLRHSSILSSVSHSSDATETLSMASEDLSSSYRFAVIGNNQEAAEIVDSICSMRNPHRVTWLQESSPRTTDDIDAALSHRLYEQYYSQRVNEPNAQNWAFQMYPNASLEAASRSADGKIELSYTADSKATKTTFDFAIIATGYKRPDYRRLLRPVQHLLHDNSFTINKRGSVALKSDLVQQDCGIWVLESIGHGDKSLSRIATISRQLADSLMKKLRQQPQSWQEIQPRL